MNLTTTFRAGAASDSPIIFFVHGRAGSLQVMSTFTRSVPEDWRIVFVEAPIPDPIGGFSWWDITNQEKKREQRAESLELLTRFIEGYGADHALAPAKRVALGFSQGAALLSGIIQLKPELLAGAGLLSGFVLNDVGQTAGKRPKVFIAHGTTDDVIPVAKAHEGVARLEGQGYPVTLITEPIGHKVGIQGMRALKEWLIAL